MQKTLGIISHQDCLLHDMGPHHPECPARIRTIDQAIHASSHLLPYLKFYTAKPAEKEDLSRIHDPVYVEDIFENAPLDDFFIIDPDTVMNPHTLKAALLAAGAVQQGVDLVMKQEVKHIFCNVRPPGHHAEHDRAMGFCFFNNIALGASYALEKYDLNKVAILDFDVHHGNGTQDIFQYDDRVLFCSTYQYPLYPLSPVVEHDNRILHSPISMNEGSMAFRQAVETVWLPALMEFKPEFIFISAGFDAHEDDPLANLNFTTEDYYWVTKLIREYAHSACHGRVVSSLEGGYNLSALSESVVAHLSGFIPELDDTWNKKSTETE